MNLLKIKMIFKSSEGAHLKLNLQATTLQLYYNLLSPQPKQCVIVTYKVVIYEFLHELPNDLIKQKQLRKLGNIMKVSKLHRMIA